MKPFEIIKTGEKTTDILVNGKSVARSYVRGWQKAEKTPYFRMYELECPLLATNPFSGATVELNQLEATIYQWLVKWYMLYSRGIETHAPIQAYDDMKYFLLFLNKGAYYALID